MLGSGLFVLPGVASGFTGPSVWLAYMVAGLCVLPAALSKAELATAMPVSGGTFVYNDRTFGPLIGTITGLGSWVSLLLKSAFALVGFGAYLAVLADVPLKPVALSLLVIVIALNVLGVRKVGKIQMIVVVLALVSLIALTARGFVTMDRALLQPHFTHGTLGFWTTVSFVYISYAGVTKVAAIAEEVENPGRNLPVGILLSLGTVTCVYAGVTFAYASNVPQATDTVDLRPIYTLAKTIAGPIVGVGAAVLGVITMTSMAMSGLLAASRFPFAMSRANLLPSFLRRVSSRFLTPVTAIAVTGSLMGAALLLLNVEGIAKLASALMIVDYLILNLAVVVLRESSIQWYKPPFQSPMYPVPQIAGVLLSLALLFMLGWLSVIALVTITGAGLLLFWGFGRRHTDRRGVLGRLGPRRELLAPATEQHVQLPTKAAVVVALRDRGRDAETLAQLGGALGGGAKVEVVHISDVPEQTALDAHFFGDPIANSLRRRIEGLGKREQSDLTFDAIVTHDFVQVVHDISNRVHCEWLLMEWRARGNRGVLDINPLGWLANHLSCNLAVFRDQGIHYFQKILVFTEPGPNDALVTVTADHLARVFDADLAFVRFVPDNASDDQLRSEEQYLEQLQGMCSRQSSNRLVRGKKPIEELTAITAEYDLLITGAPPDASLWDYIRGIDEDRLMRHAGCSVLRLKAPRRLADRIIMRHESLTDASRLRLEEYLVGECIGAQWPAMTKQALFTRIAKRFARAIPNLSAEQIEEALWERERTQNTSLGDGLAVPHATVAGVTETFAGVFTTAEPIDYKASDSAPADVFFVTLGPPSERNTHLGLLAAVARLVTQTPFLERVRAADHDSELLAVLLASSTLHGPGSSTAPGRMSGPPSSKPSNPIPPADEQGSS